MADVKVKDFNEYLLENVKAAREETREFKNDIGKRMDGLESRLEVTRQDLDKRMDGLEKRMDRLENRMDKLEDKIETTRRELNQRMDKLDARIDKFEEKLDSSMKEIRDLVAASQKDIRSSERHSQILISTIVSLVVVVLCSILLH